MDEQLQFGSTSFAGYSSKYGGNVLGSLSRLREGVEGWHGISTSMRVLEPSVDGTAVFLPWCDEGSRVRGREGRITFARGFITVALPEGLVSPSLGGTSTSVATSVYAGFLSRSRSFWLLLCYYGMRSRFCQYKIVRTLPRAPCDPYPDLPSGACGAHSLPQPKPRSCSQVNFYLSIS